MNLVGMSSLAFWLGAIALAGGLYLAQRLRVRHREVVVPTTLFWRDALEEARARTLVERFRHPLAYALVLLLATLAWLAYAQPVASHDDGREHLFLLDGSASMAAPGRTERATDALFAEVRRTDRAHRRVVLCGSGLETLLAPGEDELLLRERLALHAPEACAPTVEDALLALAAKGERDVVVHVIGDAPVRARTLDLLGDGVDVVRVVPRDRDETQVPAPGIVATLAGPAPDGDVDVAVDVVGATSRLVARVGDRVLEPTGTERVDASTTRTHFGGLPSDGSLVEFALEGASGPRARAALVLPDLGQLRVALSPRVPESLRIAVRAYPGVFITSKDADVVVRVAGDDYCPGVPAIEVAPAADQDDTFVLVHPGDRDPRTLLFRAVGDLGLEWIDTGALADTAGRSISLGEREGERRGLSMWRELLEEPFDFTDEAAFPVFVARALEWVAGRDETSFGYAAGEPVANARGAYRRDGDDTVVDPVGGPFVAPTAGVYRAVRDTGDGPPVVAAGPARTYGDDALVVRTAGVAPSSAFDLWNLVLLVLLGLLVLEWSLVRRGRMP